MSGSDKFSDSEEKYSDIEEEIAATKIQALFRDAMERTNIRNFNVQEYLEKVQLTKKYNNEELYPVCMANPKELLNPEEMVPLGSGAYNDVYGNGVVAERLLENQQKLYAETQGLRNQEEAFERTPHLVAKTSPMQSTNNYHYSHSPQADMDLTEFLKKMTGKNELEPNDQKNIYNLGLMILGLNLAAHGHRDIKPDNIFVYMNPDGTASYKLGDFGLSIGYDKMDPSNDANRTSGVGTPKYMPPEVIKSSIEGEIEGYSSQADTYSMGCILALVYGRRDCNRTDYNLLPNDQDDNASNKDGRNIGLLLRTLSGENSKRRKKYGLIGSHDPAPSLRKLRIHEPVMSSIIRKMLKVDPNERGEPTEHLKKFLPTWLDEVIPDTGDETVENNIMELKNFIYPETKHTLDKDIQAVKLLVTAIAINFQSPYFMEKLNEILKKENGAEKLFENIKLLDAENDPKVHKYARACVTHHENFCLELILEERSNVTLTTEDLNALMKPLHNNEEFEAFIKEMKDKIPEIIKTSNDWSSFLEELKNKEFAASLIPDFEFKHRDIKSRVLADLVVFALFFPIIIPIIIPMILFSFAKTKKTLMGWSFTFAKTNRAKILDGHRKEQLAETELITGRAPKSPESNSSN